MDPEVWGPKLWFVIHTIALNYPDNPSYDDVRNTENFFNSLKTNIPCDKCRMHYTERLDKTPIINHLSNSDSLFRYTIGLHNDVNISLGKRTYNYDEVIEIYKREYNTNETKASFVFNKITIGIIILLLVVVFIVIYYRKIYRYRIIKS
jgi:hypothetical protein